MAGRVEQVPAVRDQLRPQRVAVVGTSGSGKTTLAQRLAQRLGVPHVELDALNWGPNWTPASREEFRSSTWQALAGDAWITDGNYKAVRDIVWGRADTVVWLDYSLAVVMARVTWRTIQRTVTRSELWSGNRERFREAFFGRESIIWWAFSTYGRRKREYPVLFSRPEYAHLHVVRLASPGVARRWVETLPTMSQTGVGPGGRVTDRWKRYELMQAGPWMRWGFPTRCSSTITRPRTSKRLLPNGGCPCSG